MSTAFVVMQIGDPKLDHLFETVIQPAIEAVGLQAKRVDRDNEGGLLKSEIIEFLNNSEIIVADLTNERPSTSTSPDTTSCSGNHPNRTAFANNWKIEFGDDGRSFLRSLRPKGRYSIWNGCRPTGKLPRDRWRRRASRPTWRHRSGSQLPNPTAVHRSY